jgi:hypothetical protein
MDRFCSQLRFGFESVTGAQTVILKRFLDQQSLILKGQMPFVKDRIKIYPLTPRSPRDLLEVFFHLRGHSPWQKPHRFVPLPIRCTPGSTHTSHTWRIYEVTWRLHKLSTVIVHFDGYILLLFMCSFGSASVSSQWSSGAGCRVWLKGFSCFRLPGLDRRLPKSPGALTSTPSNPLLLFFSYLMCFFFFVFFFLHFGCRQCFHLWPGNVLIKSVQPSGPNFCHWNHSQFCSDLVWKCLALFHWFNTA